MKYDKVEKQSVAVQNDSIEYALAEGEEILWQGKPKKSAYIINKVFTLFPIVLLWIAFDVTFIIMAFRFVLPLPFKIGICVFMAFHLIPFWLWLSRVITVNRRYKNTQYALTTHRILMRTGFVGIDFQSLSYKDILGVHLKVGFMDKILKVGDVYFGGGIVFFDIENPYEVYKIAQKIVTDIQTDIAFPNAYRPDFNPGYNTKPKQD